MNAKRSSLVLPVLGMALALVVPTVAEAQGQPGLMTDITVGYRFVQVGGNNEMYRSQINERAGFLIRSMSLVSTDWMDKSPVVDNFRLDAADIGVGNKGLMRLDIGKTGIWRLKAKWDQQQLFSALPSFANPFYPGVVPGQQTYDRNRNILDTDLEFMPDCAFSPFVGYTWNQLYGTGKTTMHVGENEYWLNQGMNDVDQEVRVGATFHVAWLSGQVTQGWRKYTGNQTLSLIPGYPLGNNLDPMGRTQVISSLNDASQTTVNAPVTNAWLALTPFRGFKLLGAYTYTRGSGEGAAAENAAGKDLVSFNPAVLSFFSGLTESSATSEANTKVSRLNGRLEWNIVSGLDLTGGYTHGKRELSGLALATDYYTGRYTFTGSPLENVTDLVKANAQMNRTDDTYDVGLSYKLLGPVALRAAFGQTKSDITVERAPSLVIIGGGDGTFQEKVTRYEGGLTFAMAGVTLGGDWRHETGDQAVLRTSFTTRDRIRARLGFKLAWWLNLGGVAEWIDYKNDLPGIGLDGKTRNYYGNIDIVPAKWIAIHGMFGRTTADSTIPVKLPYTYRNDWVTSANSELGNSAEGSIDLNLGPISLTGGLGTFQNTGSYGFRIDRQFARANLDFTKVVGLVGEWRHDEFREKSVTPMGNYDANRYGIYLRYSRE